MIQILFRVLGDGDFIFDMGIPFHPAPRFICTKYIDWLLGCGHEIMKTLCAFLYIHIDREQASKGYDVEYVKSLIS